MRWRTRAVLVASAAGAAVALASSAALAAASTGWLSNTASRLLTVDGCSVVQSGYFNYGSAAEHSSCAGDIGLAVKYKPSSVTYTTGVLWAGSSVRWNAPNVTYVNVSH